MTGRSGIRWFGGLLVILVVLAGAGFMLLEYGPLPWEERADAEEEAAPASDREVAYWVAPMDSSFRRDEPGKSPMGMDLVPVYVDEIGEPGQVRLGGAIRMAMGIRHAEATRAPLPRVIHAPGRVEYDEAARGRVHTRVAGWVDRLRVREVGREVRRGEALFDLYSPELVSAQEELLQAQRGGRDLMVSGARERLRAMGLDAGQIDSIARAGQVREWVTVHAPRDGIIESLEVTDGMYVEPRTTALTIVDRSSVWVIADVFQRDAGWLDIGHPAQVRVPHRPGEELQTTIEFVPPALDRRTRSVPVRLRLDNPAGDLRPGMYASVRIEAPAGEPVVTVPEQAVIRTGRQDRIVIALPDDVFEVRPVTLGRAADRRREIRSGVEPGERVVVSGQFLIDSESDLDAESERMGAADDPPGAADDAMEDETHSAIGAIQGMDRDGRVVKLAHEPVEALGWPEMTMDFAVGEGVDLDPFARGDAVRFEFRARDGGGYEVIRLEARGRTDGQDSG